MIRKIKYLLQYKERKVVLKNFFSLSILQVANYILPLITLPYLVRVLGPEKFGLIAFAQAFLQYFIMLTDFGFNLSATREISINRENKQKISDIFVSVFIIKAFLLILSIIIILVIVNCFDRFYADRMIYYLTSLSIIGWLLFPQWFFQGIENMKFVTVFNILAKLFFTICVFIFIKTSDDYLLLPLINSLGLFLSGVISIYFSIKHFGIRFSLPKFKEIKHQFNESWYLFVSNLSINLYTTSNSVILGILTNNTIVGYYSAAERIFKAFQLLGMPLYQAVYPFISKLFVDNKNEAIYVFNRLFKYTMVFTFGLSVILTISSPLLVKLLLGDGFEKSTIILSLLSWVVLASWGNYILGINGLVNFGFKDVFAKLVLIVGLIHIVILTVSINYFGYIAVPLVWFFTESIICILEYRFLKKKKIINSK